MSAAADIPVWSRNRTAALTFITMVIQALLILWLSTRKPQPHVAEPPITHVALPAVSAVVPMTFDAPADEVLPGLHGFSGPAWLKFSTPEYTTAAWTEPARDLPMPADKLGSSLGEILEKKPAITLAGLTSWNPNVQPVEPLGFVSKLKSHLEVREGLARWASNSIPELHAQPSVDILKSTIIMAGVDDGGTVFSAIVMPYGKSGSTAADWEALSLVRAAKFFGPPIAGQTANPVNGAGSLHWGQLVFHWVTVAPPEVQLSATNAP